MGQLYEANDFFYTGITPFVTQTVSHTIIHPF